MRKSPKVKFFESLVSTDKHEVVRRIAAGESFAIDEAMARTLRSEGLAHYDFDARRWVVGPA